MIANEVDLKSLQHPLHAIFRFKDDCDIRPRPGRFLSATFDPSEKSPDGEFMWVGNTRGDNITGWVKLDEIEVWEIVYEFTDEQPPKLPNGTFLSQVVGSNVTIPARQLNA